jgi:uncharacterized protein (TIGR00725 family)
MNLSAVTIGVMGSGTDEYDDLARPLGALLAELGVNLLTGRGKGVMTAVSRAFVGDLRRRGICIGVVPCASKADRATPKAGYPNAFVELAIFTHLPYSGEQGTDDLSRNHVNVLSCAAIVALPGGPGTAAEVELAIRYRKPVVVYSPNAELVRHFPGCLTPADRIDSVERFLRLYVRS